MITDVEIAQLCVGIYDYPDEPSVEWDVFEFGVDDGVCWGVKRFGDVDVVVFRGSVTVLDWLRDFDAWAVSVSDPRLGSVHAGFLKGMDQAWLTLQTQIGPKVVICGHSLGAARAAILTGLMVLDRVSPIARVVFGEPQPGFQMLANLVATVPGRSYRNGDDHHHDLVTDIPYRVPPLDYTRSTPLIHVTAVPKAEHWFLGCFAYHHMQLYRDAVRAIAKNESNK